MNNESIGAFDSGLGGLTVVSQIHKYLPDESIVYFGDTGRVPYGSRSNETIIRYAKQDINFLKSHHVKLIVAACGTVSSVAAYAAEGLNVPFVEVVTPAAEIAAKTTKNGRIGVIGTAATVASHSFKNKILNYNQDLEVFEHSCSLFVPFVEAGFVSPDDDLVVGVVKRYIEPLVKENVDTLILGCTHYPILAPAIQKVVGDEVNLINTGEAAAIKIKQILTENDMLAEEKSESHFFVSDTTQTFLETSEILLGKTLDFDIKKVNIENY